MKRAATAPNARSDEFAIAADEPVYVIGVVSELVQLPIWTLRVLDREGLVKAHRRAGRSRLYSLADVRRLRHIRVLMIEQGVNIQGIRVILQIRTPSDAARRKSSRR